MSIEDRFFLPEGYRINPEPRYENDIQDGGVIWQPEVYFDAFRRVREEKRRPVLIDVGCGRAGKLFAFEGETIGIDHGPNVEFLRGFYPERLWVDCDLEQEVTLPFELTPLLCGSTIICADVIEHLRNPTALLLRLRKWAAIAKEVVLSTPDRFLHYGKPQNGPPNNRCHVREWDAEELAELLDWFGFKNVELSFTRSSSASPDRKTIQAVIRNPAG